MRGVAVLLVLLYHCTFPLCAGGYVGVDVFFVISGYLITRLLLHDLDSEAFSLKAFYIRRLRRLYPATVATTALTVVAGVIILSPPHLKELGSSSIATLLSVSNFYFSSAGGYFATAAKLKPLLHTWSLGVEEQFYLVWPLSFWLIYRIRLFRRFSFVLIGAACVCGLLLSQFWIGRNPAQAYFLLPFRAHQLLIGALAVEVERRLRPIDASAAQWLSGLGLAALVVCAVLFDESTPFPGFASAAPALATFLVVVAGSAHAVNRLLILPLLTWVGRLSYSIYLAHWPIVVYARYLHGDQFETIEKWLLLVASIAAGALLHYGVEKPWRLGAGERRWREAAGVGLAGFTAIALTGVLVMTNGWPQRMALAPEKRDYAEEVEFAFLRGYRDGVLKEGTAESGRKVLIFGDSMMQNYVPALMGIPQFRAADVTVVTRGGCVLGWGALRIVNHGVDRECRLFRDTIFHGKSRYDVVVWAQNWAGYGGTLFVERGSGVAPATGDGVALWREIIDGTLAQLTRRSGKVVMIGPPLTIEGIPETLDRIGPITDTRQITAALTQLREVRAGERDRLQDSLRQIAGDALLIDPRAIVCPTGSCRLHDDRTSYFLDSNHFTAAMTPVIAPLLQQQVAPALLVLSVRGFEDRTRRVSAGSAESWSSQR
ncbi:hypothetical protein CCR94_17975 [Rhodoblastus sphagnicola]|uniref:Acyltransferase n=2 Tax=Rhodoblastus sphagnicola TaxID=333368 RepID=A0A2S6N167_9HYPH|nr:peptidoglycan/LPS O-acetylase OafA/YrhL [Rhodoblastus sphagnicola]PPQ28365.1 hypothetical protein CCR94_17975 [Rhodoblastus sphagnicola]